MFTKRYKFLRSDDGQRIWSEHRNVTWEVGQWQEGREDLAMCEHGFHCCRDIYSAFTYVQGEVLAEVEVDGSSIADPDDDKEVWQKMRVVRAWRWQKRDSVALAVFVAELVLTNYEKKYLDDARSRQAIESARRWLADPTVEHEVAAASAARSAESAARSAWSTESARSTESAARSAWSAAWSAGSAAWSAARSAWSAAWSAGSAESDARSTESAARSAWSAAWSAESAAGSAARSAVRQEIARWMDDHLAELEEMPAQKAS